MLPKKSPLFSLGIFVLAVVISLLCSAFPSAFASNPVRYKIESHNNCVGCIHDEAIIRRWSSQHFPTSYAGMYFKGGSRLRLIVGYTEAQAARVRAIKQLPGLIDPQRVSAFPYVPRYSLGELVDLEQDIVHNVLLNDTYLGVAGSVGVIVQANRLDVGSEHIRRARVMLNRLYGPAAPIHVRYEEAPIEV